MGLISDLEVSEALEGLDIRTIERASDELWYDLPVRFAEPLLRAVARLDDATVEAHPRLLLAAFFAHAFISSPGDVSLARARHFYLTRGPHYAARLAAFRDPGDLVAAGMAAMIGARMRGALSTAERIGERVEHLMGRVDVYAHLPWSRHRSGSRPGWVAAQRAFVALFDGRWDDAIGFLNRAFLEIGPPPHHHVAGVNACANLVFFNACHGYTSRAREWLVELQQLPPVPEPIAHLAMMGADLGRAWLAMDEMDLPRATEAVDAAGVATDQVEHWPWIASTRARLDLLLDQPVAGLARLEEACTAHGVTLSGAPGGGVVQRAFAELRLAEGNGTTAIELARQGRSPAYVAPAAARAYLLSDEPRRAIRVAAHALRAHTIGPRAALDLQLSLAIAYLRVGDADAARECAEHVHAMFQVVGDRTVFRDIEPSELQMIWAVAPRSSAMVHEGRAWRRAKPRIVSLTARERLVLEHLAGEASVVDIAARLTVAVSTVRSQVRSIYRKLEVRNREDAVAQAVALGLLHGRPPLDGDVATAPRAPC